MIFSGLKFLVVVSEGLSNETSQNLVEILQDNGCESVDINHPTDDVGVNYDGEALLEMFSGKMYNFIVAGSVQFPFYSAMTTKFMVPTVSSQWVFDCIAKDKILRVTEYSVNPKHILKMCSVYVSQNCFSDLERQYLCEMTEYLGGIATDVLVSTVSHIITKNPMDPTLVAVESIQGRATSIEYVYPTWLLASLHYGRLQPEKLHEIIYMQDTSLSAGKLIKLYKLVDEIVPMSVKDTLMQRSFFVSEEDGFDRNLVKSLKSLINANGGNLVESLKNDPDVYIGYSRASSDYRLASQKKIVAGNFSWLFYMLANEKYLLPTDLLHLGLYPEPIFKKDELIATYTNFHGLQRSYIRKVVKALGGKTTPSLSEQNTHIVFGRPTGLKYSANLQNCSLVNHYWLDECYSTQSKLDPEKYRSEIVTTSFTQTIGQKFKPISDYIQRNDAESVLDTSVSDHTTTVKSQTASTLESASPPQKYIEGTELEAENITQVESPITSMTVQQSKTKHSSKRSGVTTQEKLSNETLNPVEPSNFSQKHNKLEETPAIDLTQESNSEKIISSLKQPVSASESLDVLSSRNGTLKNTIDSSHVTNKRDHLKIYLNDDFTSSASDVDSVKSVKRSKVEASKLASQSTQKQALSLLTDVLNEGTLQQVVESHNGQITEQCLYDINAVSTGCLENISVLDLELLRFLGINIHQNIETNNDLNAIIAPKKLRTAKFLTSYSFQPLKYAILPEFITKLLKLLHSGKRQVDLKLDVSKYTIPGLQMPKITKITSLTTKVFERAGLHTVNLVDTIPGGTKVIANILKAHGVQTVNVLTRNFTLSDLQINEQTGNAAAEPPGHNQINHRYVLITNKASQVKRLKKLLNYSTTNPTANSESALAVEWNWCVKCIFNLTTEPDQNTNEGIIFETPANHR